MERIVRASCGYSFIESAIPATGGGVQWIPCPLERGLPRPTMELAKSNAFAPWASNVASGFPSLYAQNQASPTQRYWQGWCRPRVFGLGPQ